MLDKDEIPIKRVTSFHNVYVQSASSFSFLLMIIFDNFLGQQNIFSYTSVRNKSSLIRTNYCPKQGNLLAKILVMHLLITLQHEVPKLPHSSRILYLRNECNDSCIYLSQKFTICKEILYRFNHIKLNNRPNLIKEMR